MNKLVKGLAAAAVVVVGLSGCAALDNIGNVFSSVGTVINSDVGQAFIKTLGVGGSVFTGVQEVATAIDNGISSPAAQRALNTVCYALPWADGALDTFGPSLKIPAQVLHETDMAVATFVAGPCTVPPVNLAQVVAQGTKLFLDIQATLKAGGVPVAVPVSARLAS